MQLFPHQERLMEMTEDFANVGYFVEMGLGKTYLATEKMKAIGNDANLIVCQKSKIGDWLAHVDDNYPEYSAFDLTNNRQMALFLEVDYPKVGIINYELLWRRPQVTQLKGFTLILDESSLIQNETTERASFILKRLDFANVVLLSGTVVNGNYEKLWSQCQLLGWPISRDLFDRQYVQYRKIDDGSGYPRKIPDGYKNVERLKRKLRDYGGVFMKTAEVYEELPETVFQLMNVPTSPEYRRFEKDKVIPVEEKVLIGDMLLTERMYKRMLCGQYSKAKLQVFEDLLESTDDRLIVFYWFTEEYERLREICEKHRRPVSVINGEKKDLEAYETCEDSVTLCQYQAAAMGHNLQLANKMILYSLPDGDMELYEQCLKRIDRIGQTRPCYYYILMCHGSIEEEIWMRLNEKKARKDELFEPA